MRKLGLLTIFHALNFSNVQNLFDESGKLLEPEPQIRRLDSVYARVDLDVNSAAVWAAGGAMIPVL